MRQLTFNEKRVALGVLLVIALASVANCLLDLNIAGPYGKQVIILCFVAMVLFQHFVGPSLEDVIRYREQNPQK